MNNKTIIRRILYDVKNIIPKISQVSSATYITTEPWTVVGSCLLWVMSTETSVDIAADIAVDIAVDSRSIVGRQSVDSRSIVGRQSVDSRSIVGR